MTLVASLAIVALAAALIYEKWKNGRQVSVLLDRIQAPEKVVYPVPEDNVIPLPFDDDKAYQEAKLNG